MKTKKDIIMLIVALVVLGGCGFFLYRMLAPSSNPNAPATNTPTQTTTTFTGNIDQETLAQVTDKKDYGEASLDNIGRTNPFGPLN